MRRPFCTDSSGGPSRLHPDSAVTRADQNTLSALGGDCGPAPSAMQADLKRLGAELRNVKPIETLCRPLRPRRTVLTPLCHFDRSQPCRDGAGVGGLNLSASRRLFPTTTSSATLLGMPLSVGCGVEPLAGATIFGRQRTERLLERGVVRRVGRSHYANAFSETRK